MIERTGNFALKIVDFAMSAIERSSPELRQFLLGGDPVEDKKTPLLKSLTRLLISPIRPLRRILDNFIEDLKLIAEFNNGRREE